MNSASTAPSADSKSTDTSKPKRARAAKAKKVVAPKAEKKKAVPIPESAADLRLAPGGVRASERNRYLNIEFTNGFTVRLFPVGLSKRDVPKVRDLLIEWLNKG